MAIAGLHNASAFDSSFLGESQSPVSRLWGKRERPRGRASSLLQMWRKLEGECTESNAITRFGDGDGQLRSEVGTCESDGQGSGNGDDGVEDVDVFESECRQNQTVLENENCSVTSFNSDQSIELGEIERQRVKRVFQEWMSNGVKIHSLNTSRINGQSRVEWLVHNQQKGSNTSHRDEGSAENSSQIERVSDWLLVNDSENGAWRGRRALQRLRGRQALLDLLQRAQMQRKRELQSLMERRPVSDFAYRNRIQSLLKGRFLRNERLIWDERPASVAASELGLLRQRQTVSYLREGFLSKLDCNEHNALENVHPQSNIGEEVIDNFHEQAEFVYESREINGSQRLENSETLRDMNQHETTVQTDETSERSLEYEGYGQKEAQCLQCNESIHNGELDASQNSGGLSDASESSQVVVVMEDMEGQLPKDHEASDPNGESIDVHNMEDGVGGSEINTINNFDRQGNEAQEEESVECVTECEEIDWQQLFILEFSERAEGAREDTTESWHESDANQWYPKTPDNDAEEQSHVQESDNEWDGNAMQESVVDRVDTPSTQSAVPVGMADTFYIPDDDNVYSMELRELLNRRRVSNLLQSDFRGSLDLLLQSYVDRQGQASFDWEIDGTTSSPSAIDQDQQQENGHQDEGDISDIERNHFPPTTSPGSLSQPFRDQELQGSNMLFYNPHPHTAMEGEIINELRIDMDRLQQQMNNMQRMLETCMDMQLELQHSVQHEVFAALNRNSVSKDAKTPDDSLLKDETKWDYMRKGICCLCCTRCIDSLLYRCGHMCTCSKFAEELVQGHGKCPMCQASVAEMIRAYSIQQ